jgi:hypothetical protein
LASLRRNQGILTYAHRDPLSASIRGGYLYSTYQHDQSVHVDQQKIETWHFAWLSEQWSLLALTPTWGADVGAEQTLFPEDYTAPLLEVAANGAVVLSYSVVNGAGLLDARSTTFLPDGTPLPEQAWASGPFTGKVDGRAVNRASVDPNDPWSVWILGVGGAGGSSYQPWAQSVTVDPGGCANNTATNSFPFGAVGCGGAVTFDMRQSLCSPGYTVCTASQWAAVSYAIAPSADYWTDDNLGYGGSPGACLATTQNEGNCGVVDNTQGVSVPSPMRVCTPSGSDDFGNRCNWTGCGLNAPSPNLSFGGCYGDATAGALCCPVGLGCANGLPDDVFSTFNGSSSETRMVGCGGAVTWDQRASLCGVGYSPCKASQWTSIPGTPRPSNNYWTDDKLGWSGSNGNCSATTSGQRDCGVVLNAQDHLVPAPMRVCTSIGRDSYGNFCNWTGCGLDSTANEHFGGCNQNATAGTLCCAD